MPFADLRLDVFIGVSFVRPERLVSFGGTIIPI